MKVTNSSNRGFGLVFFIFFFIVSIYPLFKSGELRYWSLIIAFVFISLGLINSKLLNPLNKIWIKFGNMLGIIISPLVMGVIFFFIITPTSIILSLLGKDILNLKKNKSKSYWIAKSGPKSNMKNQF